MEGRALVAEAFFTGAALFKVLEVLAPRRLCAHQPVGHERSLEVDGVQVMIYAPRVAVEAQLDAPGAASNANVEKDRLRHVGLRFLEQAVEHAKVLHRLGLHLGRARLNAAALAIREESFSILSTAARRGLPGDSQAARGYYVVDGFATTATVELNWGLEPRSSWESLAALRAVSLQAAAVEDAIDARYRKYTIAPLLHTPPPRRSAPRRRRRSRDDRLHILLRVPDVGIAQIDAPERQNMIRSSPARAPP